ncbi:hypothetical protein [Pseudomonas sp. Snoq117.2]|uniref:hypothetical protein n=1 Tax=Pseudomonas sp. Snoq117.2 TaxID=1500302 RepID=UPI0008B04D91|nr:hypothetical protein [Pseudomonas sp. Snoq117.2]SEO64001.1 hypothetical protein SAMN02787149_101797 [Pseudomonas sp. Snoq117.2]
MVSQRFRSIAFALIAGLALTLTRLDQCIGLSARASYICRDLPAVASAKFRLVMALWRAYEPVRSTRPGANLIASSNHFSLANALRDRAMPDLAA